MSCLNQRDLVPVQERVQANTHRIAQIEAEIQGLEGGIGSEAELQTPARSAVPAAAVSVAAEREWLPAAFSRHLKPGTAATVQVCAAQHQPAAPQLMGPVIRHRRCHRASLSPFCS